ncbi:MAG: flagellar filament capping protein FliD [Lachnotalea sp.]
MLYNFYNYYLNSNTPKSANRYDTHKRSELKNIYNAIVKLNKESPLYIINLSDDLQNSLIDIKEHARSLKNIITEISENEDEDTAKMFNDKIPTSSNEEILTVDFIGSETEIDNTPSFDVEVSELASPQINKGNFLYKNSRNLSSNTYSFNITILNTNYEFQFLVKDKETNADVLEKVSNMLNRADIGIFSSIESNDTDEKQRLVLTSTATGSSYFSDIIFQITDNNTSNASGSVHYLGLDQIANLPTDSKFTINGLPRTSSSNVFTVNKTFEFNLHRTTENGETVNVSFKNDKTSTYKKISDFVTSYNDIINLANDDTSSFKMSTKLLADIGSISQCYKSELDSMGLIVQKDSSIAIDEISLNKAIDDEEAGNGTFASFRTFKNPLSRKVDSISLNPMAYITKTIVTYPNIDNSYSNAYATSMYSGLMFNNYC